MATVFAFGNELWRICQVVSRLIEVPTADEERTRDLIKLICQHAQCALVIAKVVCNSESSIEARNVLSSSLFAFERFGVLSTIQNKLVDVLKSQLQLHQFAPITGQLAMLSYQISNLKVEDISVDSSALSFKVEPSMDTSNKSIPDYLSLPGSLSWTSPAFSFQMRNVSWGAWHNGTNLVAGAVDVIVQGARLTTVFKLTEGDGEAPSLSLTNCASIQKLSLQRATEAKGNAMVDWVRNTLLSKLGDIFRLRVESFLNGIFEKGFTDFTQTPKFQQGLRAYCDVIRALRIPADDASIIASLYERQKRCFHCDFMNVNDGCKQCANCARAYQDDSEEEEEEEEEEQDDDASSVGSGDSISESEDMPQHVSGHVGQKRELPLNSTVSCGSEHTNEEDEREHITKKQKSKHENFCAASVLE